jgi:hypothetical protein
MQTYELVMIALIGTTVILGLSAALYSSLPASVLEYASRHGRYLGLGIPLRAISRSRTWPGFRDNLPELDG